MSFRSPRESAFALISTKLHARADPSTANAAASAAEHLQAACRSTHDVEEILDALSTVAAELLESIARADGEPSVDVWQRFTTSPSDGDDDG